MPVTSAPRSSSAPARCEPMKPAAPVTSAFMRTACRTASGSRHGLPLGSSAAWTVRPVASDRSSRPHDLVRELHPHGRQHAARRSDLDLVVVARRLAVLAVRLDDRQREPRLLHLAIAPAERAQQVGARHLEPDEVVRVVDDAHLVGFGVAHAHCDDDRRGPARASSLTAARRLRPSAPPPRSSRVARSGSPVAEDGRARPPGSSRPPRRPARRSSGRCRRRPRWAPGCPPVEQGTDRPDLRLAAGDEGLAAEPRIDRHHQHVVHDPRRFPRAHRPASTD